MYLERTLTAVSQKQSMMGWTERCAAACETLLFIDLLEDCPLSDRSSKRSQG